MVKQFCSLISQLAKWLGVQPSLLESATSKVDTFPFTDTIRNIMKYC